jgi:uncharacterized protein (TIGR00255 family)
MTGFGKAVSELKDKTISVEIRSLNSKYLDLSLRLPAQYRQYESGIRSEVNRTAERGKIEVSVSVSYRDASLKTYSINKAIAKAYCDELKKLNEELKLKDPDYLSLVMRMPDIMVSERSDADEKEWEEVLETFNQAAREFDRFRSDEGRNLEKDMKQRVENIESLLGEIEKQEPVRTAAIRSKLEKGVREVIGADKIDQNRFEQELIFYIEKLDITEEKVRLKSHCDYFIITMKESASAGRKLGFITQEIGREINTIGSKANDAVMQKAVVQMKDELEKMKEQLNNVL